MISIYVLKDARGRVHYVGQTGMKLQARLGAHFNHARSFVPGAPKDAWLRKTNRVEIAEIERVEVSLAHAREAHWIATMRERWEPLFNIRKGTATVRTADAMRKIALLFTRADAARIDRFGSTLSLRNPSRSAFVRELVRRGLDASEAGFFDVAKPGKAKRKAARS